MAKAILFCSTIRSETTLHTSDHKTAPHTKVFDFEVKNFHFAQTFRLASQKLFPSPSTKTSYLLPARSATTRRAKRATSYLAPSSLILPQKSDCSIHVFVVHYTYHTLRSDPHVTRIHFPILQRTRQGAGLDLCAGDRSRRHCAAGAWFWRAFPPLFPHDRALSGSRLHRRCR